MPMLGDIFIENIEQESYSEGVTATNHPVEDGSEITDHIDRKPVILKITGIISGRDAHARLNKIRIAYQKGTLMKYHYRTQLSNVIITDFPHDHVVSIGGNGFSFSLTLTQIRVTNAVVVKKLTPAVRAQAAGVKNKGLQQAKGASTKSYTVKAGDSLSKIAAAQKTTVTALYERNKGTIGGNPNMIRPGQKLIIPA